MTHNAEVGRAVALVAMPFISTLRPSLQLGTLAPQVAAAGFPVQTFHFNLNFAAVVGIRVYEQLCYYSGDPWGEWLFSVAAFGEDAPDPGGTFLEAHDSTAKEMRAETRLTERGVRRVRDVLVPRYLDRLIGLVDWKTVGVVGFTSTFQQNMASLALARRIRAVAPKTLIVFGGANVEDEMGLELLRIAPWVDYVVDGEGDQALPQLLRALQAGDDALDVAGVSGRRGGEIVSARRRQPLTRLDNLPVPDFAEYFARLEELRLLDRGRDSRIMIPFESARGCWWGEKHHCTFCGLNGKTMIFRAKRPERVEWELDELVGRYGHRRLVAVDNILSRDYLKTLVKRLAAREEPLDLFYEVKANLTRGEVRDLAAAGIKMIQPGIESLSTHVLRIMRKGVSAAQNVALLRWCHFYGVQVAWNVIYGFPGETEVDCEQQVALMPLLRHLQPPGSTGRLAMERFSPIYSDRDRFPVSHFAAQDAMRYLYPEETNLARLAYLFEYQLDGALDDETFVSLVAAVNDWKAAWEEETRPWLTARRAEDAVIVEDGRDPSEPVTVALESDEASVLWRLLDKASPDKALAAALGISEPRVSTALRALSDRGLVAPDVDRWFAVPVLEPTDEPDIALAA